VPDEPNTVTVTLMYSERLPPALQDRAAEIDAALCQIGIRCPHLTMAEPGCLRLSNGMLSIMIQQVDLARPAASVLSARADSSEDCTTALVVTVRRIPATGSGRPPISALVGACNAVVPVLNTARKAAAVRRYPGEAFASAPTARLDAASRNVDPPPAPQDRSLGEGEGPQADRADPQEDALRTARMAIFASDLIRNIDRPAPPDMRPQIGLAEQLTVYVMSVTLMVLSFPVGVGVLFLNILTGANLRVTSHAMALTGFGFALTGTDVGRTLIALL